MTMPKRLLACLFFLAVFSFPLSASMVSFLVVETGLNEESDPGRYSSLWEGGLMSAFFDAGHIVSNGAILRLGERPAKDLPDEAARDYDEAVSGGAEYFILALLDYKNEGGKIVPSGISLRLFSASAKSIVYQQSYAALRGASLDDEYARAREAARAIIPHLKDR